MDRARCLLHSIRPSTPIDVSRVQVYPWIAGRSFSGRPAPVPGYRERLSKFSYRVAVASNPKNRKFDPRRDVIGFSPRSPLTFDVDNVDIPSTSYLASGDRPGTRRSQDAFFVSDVGKSPDVALGVADGVGGWAAEGVNPADFSHALCGYMARRALENDKSPFEVLLRPLDLMQAGYSDLTRDSTITAGGSTATVAVARANGRMDIANLGDSGFVHMQQKHLRARSHPLCHDFNTPYQLSIIPSELQARAKMFGGGWLSDSPTDAREYSFWVRSGDVLVFATDGLWDNVHFYELHKLVFAEMKRRRAWVPDDEGIRVGDDLRLLTDHSDPRAGFGTTLQEGLANTIAWHAKQNSVNSTQDTPFAKSLRDHDPREQYHGGKVDDICVIVVIPVEEE